MQFFFFPTKWNEHIAQFLPGIYKMNKEEERKNRNITNEKSSE